MGVGNGFISPGVAMPVDWAQFYQNRNAFPLEELQKYAGRWIAWGPDGSAVVASSAESEDALYELMKATGLDPSECCVSYVPGPDDVLDGPFILNRISPRRDEDGPPEALPPVPPG